MIVYAPWCCCDHETSTHLMEQLIQTQLSIASRTCWHSFQGEIGKTLSGFDQWSAIIGDRPESSSPVRNEVVLGRNSYSYDEDSSSMIKIDPRGAYIYDGWKVNIGDK